jgi:hypothetical protein
MNEELISRVRRERDEARARIAELESIDALEAKIAPIIRVAEARGYERGVKEAAALAEHWLGPDSYCQAAILALLEKEATNGRT